MRPVNLLVHYVYPKPSPFGEPSLQWVIMSVIFIPVLERSSKWKKSLSEGAAGIFGDSRDQNKKGEQELMAKLYQQIGQLKVEKDFLENALGR